MIDRMKKMMLNKPFQPTVLVVLIYSSILFFLPNTFAGTLNDLPPDQKAYVTRYVEAIRSKDENQLKALVHPRVLACIDSSNQDYFSDLFQRTLKYDVPDDYTVTIEALSAETAARESEGAKQWGLPYPVVPTHQLQIDFNKAKYSSVTILRHLVREADAFYDVAGCPSAEMVAKFREVKIKKEEAKLKAELLFKELQDPLLSELTGLLKDGRKIEAWKKYSEVTGETLATAQDVLSYIKFEGNE